MDDSIEVLRHGRITDTGNGIYVLYYIRNGRYYCANTRIYHGSIHLWQREITEREWNDVKRG